MEWLTNVVAIPGLTALYTLDGRRIDSTNRVVTPVTNKKFTKDYAGAPESCTIPTNLDFVDTPTMYLGYVTSHYGHFLTDSMSRWWATLDLDLPCFALESQKLTSNFHVEIIDALGIRLLPPTDRPTLYRRVLSPEPSLTRELDIKPFADRAHLRVTDVLYPQPKFEFSNRIFLSRLGYPSKRRIDQEAEQELENRAAAAGYQLIKPETLTFAQEIQIFNEAEFITGILGSAFLTALFSRKSYKGHIAIFLANSSLDRCGMVHKIKSHGLDGIECMSYDAENRMLNIDPVQAMNALGRLGML